MAKFRKIIKWWLRDLWALLTRKDTSKEPKTIHLIHCRACGNYHRADFQVIEKTFGGSGPPPFEKEQMRAFREDLLRKIPEDFFRGGKQQCPLNGETYYAAQDDWMHLTEREFDLGIPAKHR